MDMTNSSTFKYTFFTVLIAVVFTLQYCTPSKKAAKSEDATISYANDIKPIMERSCTPCHFPEKGRVEMLDTYEKTKSHVNEIIKRVELPKDERGFMPYMSKKTPLSKAEINLFKTWLSQDMPE